MRYILGLIVILSTFWMINSPHTSMLLLALGAISVALVTWLAHRMKLIDQESMPLSLMVRLTPFYCWLLKEIVVGSIYVLKKILLWDKTLSPNFVTLTLNFKSTLAEVIFANAITLIPGTLSVELSAHKIRIHALSKALAEQLTQGELARRISRLEASC